jgi:hypothetical protein
MHRKCEEFSLASFSDACKSSIGGSGNQRFPSTTKIKDFYLL